MQASQPTQIGVGHYVPVTPTAESLADKEIDNPLVFCLECDTVWHCGVPSRCPRCARCIGCRYFLDDVEIDDVLSAVMLLNEEDILNDSEYEMKAFRDLLFKMMPWYEDNCRLIIQACYIALLHYEPSHPKVVFAIQFFKKAYLNASDDEMMYDREEVRLSE